MRVEQERVRQFMEKIGDDLHDKPTTVDTAVAKRRYRLIHEELEEYLDANVCLDEVGVADALGDLLYTVLGLANLHGMDAQAIFDEIHRSNMTKDADPTNELKKAVKGPAYRAPELAGVLLRQSLGLDV